MVARSSVLRVWRMGLFIATALAALAGCGEEEIRHYKVARLEQPKPKVTTSGPHSDLRLLAAIVPHGDRTWFFKLVGPAELVHEQEQSFDAFVRSLRFEAGKEIDWTVPEGWRHQAGTAARFATFHLGPEENPIELTVIPLGREAGSLLANVNRWRGQLGLEAIEEADLGSITRELKGGDWTATIVDMETGDAHSHAGHSHEAVPRAPPTVSRPSLEYDVPEGWKSMPAEGFRVASFEIRSNGERADVSVTPFSGAAGGVLENVNRWRGQIGLDAVDGDQLRRELRPIEVAGITGQFVELVGPGAAGKKRLSILGVIVERADQTWFFKMTGPSELVSQQKAAYEAFVRSVRFDTRSEGKRE